MEDVIEFNFVAKGVNETVYDFSRVSDAAKKINNDVESASTKGGGALKGLGVVTKYVGHEFGVTGGMGRLLSNEIVGMAASLGRGATAASILAVAVLGTKAVYDHFSEAAKKKREEIEKNVAALQSEATALYNDQLQTDEVKKAHDRLNQSKTAEWQTEITKNIQNQTEKLKEAEEAYKHMPSVLEIGYNEMGELTKEYGRKEVAAAKKDALDKINVLRESIKEMQSMLAASFGKGTHVGYFTTMMQEWAATQGAMTKRLEQEEQRRNKISAELSNAALENAKSRETDLERIYEIDMQAFDNVTARKYESLKTYDEQSSYYTQRQLERDTLAYQHEKKINDLTIKNKQTLANETSQIFDDLYTLSDKKQKAWFYAARGAAAAEAFFSYQLAAANSVGKMGPFGIGMAAYFEALSYIKPALILATSLTGPSGGGGTSTPPSSPDSSHDWDTGGSGGSNNSTINLHLNINGKSVTMNDLGSLTSDVVKYLYDNNGSVDGLTISVDRSA